MNKLLKQIMQQQMETGYLRKTEENEACYQEDVTV